MLSGAGIVKGREKGEYNAAETIFVHANYEMVVETLDTKLVAKLSDEDRNGATLVVSKEAPIYPITLDSAGAQAEYLSAITEKEVKLLNEDGRTLDEITDALDEHGVLNADGKTIVFILGADTPGDKNQDKAVKAGDTVRIDCYEAHREGAYELQIDAKNFAGYYYIEASTLFRDEATGEDLPAEFVIPRGKIQSNFTFTMAASGDPSTFSFVIDCFPAFTKFNKKKKVMAVLQIVDNTDTTHNYKNKEVMGHDGRTSDSDVDQWYTKSIFAEGK